MPNPTERIRRTGVLRGVKKQPPIVLTITRGQERIGRRRDIGVAVDADELDRADGCVSEPGLCLRRRDPSECFGASVLVHDLRRSIERVFKFAIVRRATRDVAQDKPVHVRLSDTPREVFSLRQIARCQHTTDNCPQYVVGVTLVLDLKGEIEC